MKLPREFIRLPLDFDAERLGEEVRALPDGAWQAHPTGYPGNSAVPLISVNGEANDFFAGPMAPTPWLRQSPYLQQVLASFDVVLGRSRLMGLAGGGEVPAHSDINYHWFSRVRIHVPVITFPEVEFHCGKAAVHMAAGEAWIFDNWQSHRVVNPGPGFRVHLVADTVGSAGFWAMMRESLAAADGANPPSRLIEYDPARSVELLVERHNTPDVMHPAEMELLTEDLLADLRAAGSNPAGQVDRFESAVRAFCADWKSLWALQGPDPSGWSAYEHLRDGLLKQLLAIRAPLKVASNARIAQKVMYARVLVACINKPIPGMNEIQYPR